MRLPVITISLVTFLGPVHEIREGVGEMATIGSQWASNDWGASIMAAEV